jgi:hypothetical protein
MDEMHEMHVIYRLRRLAWVIEHEGSIFLNKNEMVSFDWVDMEMGRGAETFFTPCISHCHVHLLLLLGTLLDIIRSIRYYHTLWGHPYKMIATHIFIK